MFPMTNQLATSDKTKLKHQCFSNSSANLSWENNMTLINSMQSISEKLPEKVWLHIIMTEYKELFDTIVALLRGWS